MLTLPGLSLVLEDRRRAGKKLLLPDVEKVGMNGQFAADRGNGDAMPSWRWRITAFAFSSGVNRTFGILMFLSWFCS